MNKTERQYIGVKLNPGVLNGVDQAILKVPIDKRIEEPRFRVASISLSYRLISNLRQNNLLPTDAQVQDRSWSKFSIKDHVYLMLIVELRSFGASTKQIRSLKDIFYGDTQKDATRALCAVFGHIEIVLMMYADGEIYLCDSDNAALLEASLRAHDSFIKISINKHMNRTFELAGIPYQYPTLETAAERHMRLDLESVSIKESRALELIRNHDYREIVISKKENGTLNTATARRADAAILEKAELLNVLDGFDFGQVQIVKRDGRVVHVKREDSIKL